jgi:hypothetical protein
MSQNLKHPCGLAGDLEREPPRQSVIACPACGARLFHSGRRRQKTSIRCPRCQAAVPVPPPLDGGEDLAVANRVPEPQPIDSWTSSNDSADVRLHRLNRIGTLWIPVGISCLLVAVTLMLVLLSTPPLTATNQGKESSAEVSQSANNPSITAFLERENKKLGVQIDSLNAENRRLQEDLKRLEQDRQKLQEENKQLQEKVVFVSRWRRAHFLVMDHNSFASAVLARPDGTFEVLAKAEHPWAEYARKVAYKFQIPRLDRDQRLARQLHAEGLLGQPLDQHLDSELRKYWRVHKHVPPGPNEPASFVVFRDVVQNRHRLGFFVGVDGQGLDFYPVGGNVEHVPRARIEPATALKGPGPTLRLEADTDFLDLCALSIAQKVGTTENSPRLINLAVDVSVDTLEEFLKLSKEPDSEWNDVIFDFLARWRMEPYRPDSRKAPARWLRDAARELHDEIVSRLSKLGIPLLEREEINRVIAERDLAKEHHFEPQEYGRLLCASHLVLVEVDKPSDDGKLRLSVRLDDVENGQTVWADNCDIERRKPAEVATFLLDSGKPALVTFANAKLTPNRNGLPLFLPRLQSKVEDEGPRLCYIEQTASDDRPLLRDLFRTQLHSVSPQSVKHVNEDVTIDRVPPNQRLRFVMWQVARNILPVAGRVSNVDHDRASITLGRNGRVDVGSRYKLWRVASEFDDRSSNIDHWRRLPVEVMTTEVNDSQAKVFVATSGVEQLWPEANQIAVGDLVVRKDAPAPFVAVIPPAFDLSLLDSKIATKYALLGAAAQNRIQGNVERCAERFREHTEASLKKLNVRCADPGQVARFDLAGLHAPLLLARTMGVTHLVYGSICPASVHAESQSLAISIRVLDVARGETALTLPNFPLTIDHIDQWVP